MPSSKVVLLGSTGALGTEVYAQMLTRGMDVYAPKRDEMNVQFPDAPVVNCIAMTGIDRCASEKKEALNTNGAMPLILARTGVDVLQISTEMVFACEKPDEDHSEDGKPDPQTWYGMTKLAGEKHPSHVLRLPLLFGPTAPGQIVGRLVERACAGETVRVADDLLSTPVYMPDAAEWICDWVEGKHRRPLTHLCAGKLTSLYKLVWRIACCFGAQSRVERASSREFGEPKPLFGGLRSNYENAFSLNQAILRYAETIR